MSDQTDGMDFMNSSFESLMLADSSPAADTTDTSSAGSSNDSTPAFGSDQTGVTGSTGHAAAGTDQSAAALANGAAAAAGANAGASSDARPWHTDPRFKDELETLRAIQEAGGREAIQALLPFKGFVENLRTQGFTDGQAIQAAIQKNLEDSQRQQEQNYLQGRNAELTERVNSGYLSDEDRQLILRSEAQQIDMQRQLRQMEQQNTYTRNLLVNQEISKAKSDIPGLTPQMEQHLRAQDPNQIPFLVSQIKAMLGAQTSNAALKAQSDLIAAQGRAAASGAGAVQGGSGGGSGTGGAPGAGTGSGIGAGQPTWKSASFESLLGLTPKRGTV
jgi:hypothetical protein